MISMTFIVLMYSTAMPVLYLCGVVVCAITYWTDKILFLRLYRTPPRYGLELAKGVQTVMEWAILLHLFVGLYMISNPEIFNFTEGNDPHEHFSKFLWLGKQASNVFKFVFGTES